MNGDANDLVNDTSWLLTTPAPVATNPLTSVARPKVVERSEDGMVRELAEETNHDSKTENRMDVDTPAVRRPRSRMGR